MLSLNIMLSRVRNFRVWVVTGLSQARYCGGSLESEMSHLNCVLSQGRVSTEKTESSTTLLSGAVVNDIMRVSSHRFLPSLIPVMYAPRLLDTEPKVSRINRLLGLIRLLFSQLICITFWIINTIINYKCARSARFDSNIWSSNYTELSRQKVERMKRCGSSMKMNTWST